MRLFLDVNVILDVLAEREPWFKDSAAVLSLLDGVQVEGLIAAHSVTTLYYLASRQLGHRRAVAALIDLLDHVNVTPLDEDVLIRALSLGWDDVEDAVQGVSAQRANADYLVTRNTADSRSASAPVVSPRQLLGTLASSTDRRPPILHGVMSSDFRDEERERGRVRECAARRRLLGERHRPDGELPGRGPSTATAASSPGPGTSGTGVHRRSRIRCIPMAPPGSTR